MLICVEHEKCFIPWSQVLVFYFISAMAKERTFYLSVLT